MLVYTTTWVVARGLDILIEDEDLNSVSRILIYIRRAIGTYEEGVNNTVSL